MSGGFSSPFAVYANPVSFASAGNQQTGTTVVAPSATINTKGSWVSLGALTSDCNALLLRLSYLNNNASDTGAQFDIGIGGSGSQVVIISNVNLAQPGGTPVAALNTFQHVIPMTLKTGTQVWARSASNVASSTATLGASFVAFDNSFGVGREFSGVEAVGVTGVGTGTAMTGGANVKGSYVTLGTSSRDYAGVFCCFDYGTATAGMQALVDIAIGGSNQIILPNLLMCLELGFTAMDTECFPVQIPAGTSFAARSCNVDGSTSQIGVSLYGVY